MDVQAKNVFNTICEMLDGLHINYSKREDDLAITCRVRGEDIPMPFMVRVSAEKELVSFLSVIPFDVDEDMQETICIALNMINHCLVDGCFVLYDGKISFKSAVSYHGMMAGKKLFEDMIMTSLAIVDAYNDKFVKIVLEHMSVHDIKKYLD